MIFIIIIISILFISIYFSAKLDENAIISQKTEITLYDDSISIIQNDGMYKYIKYEDISPALINAFVALEDKRFFSHKGIDYHRLLGALYNDIRTLSFREGGSTITQQLAKNTHLSNEKTLKRKIKEMRLARLIEKKYSKQQILEFYLNAIYFGNGIYGIDSASKNYFNKNACDLNPAESALLAGIVKNPTNYSPFNNTDKAIERRNLVLRLMKEQNYITDSDYEKYITSEYVPENNIRNEQPCTLYYNNAIIEASGILGISEKELITSKYKIYTYYNAELQNSISYAINSGEYDCVNEFNNKSSVSALVCDNNTGGIVGFYSNDKINIFTFKRQPASTIKPILVYAPAVEYGYISPETPVLDEKITIKGYSPSNFGDKYSGWTTAENALAKSINTVALKLYDEIGMDKCKAFAEKCGISLNENDGLASALGGITDGISQIELSEAYMTLARGGTHINNTFIKRITDENGKEIYKNANKERYVMSENSAFLVTEMLQTAVKNGTASKLNGFDYSIAAKTGTNESPSSSLNLDAWNVSYTTEATTLIWYGDMKKTEKTGINTTGSSMPTLLARKIYSLTKAPDKKTFDQPNGIFQVEIDKYAQEIDHALYLSNQFTPEKYRKKANFTIKNCPTTISPYFDINNVIFYIENDEITVSSDEDYSFILEEQDLFTGKIKYYQVKNNETTKIFPENDYGIYGYRLKVFFEGNELGCLHNKKINFRSNE